MPYREYVCIRSTSISMSFRVVGHDFNVNETTICIKYSVPGTVLAVSEGSGNQTGPLDWDLRKDF